MKELRGGEGGSGGGGEARVEVLRGGEGGSDGGGEGQVEVGIRYVVAKVVVVVTVMKSGSDDENQIKGGCWEGINVKDDENEAGKQKNEGWC